MRPPQWPDGVRRSAVIHGRQVHAGTEARAGGWQAMICILHGYLLEGSGSNLWTRSIIAALCRQGARVHLLSQENHPERYPFIDEARRYHLDGSVEVFNRQPTSCAGGCVLHKPELGDTLPVYVWDRYEEYPRVIPMVDLTEAELRDYVERNVAVLERVVREEGITALHANHSVLMSVVAQRVSENTGVPYAIMPHGSALEFAVKRDARYHALAASAFAGARRVFVIGDELRDRVRDVLPGVPGLESKFTPLHLGVDTTQFEPVPRAERAMQVAKLEHSLGQLERGRTASQTAQLRGSLRGGMDERALGRALDAVRGYEGKAPDEDVEQKLAEVDWQRDPTLLFVGRLISSKGVHSVLAALPFLLAAEPRLRVLLVGHGPLREPLEAMLWALEHGDLELLRLIVRRGRLLEGSPEGEAEAASLEECASWLDQLEAAGELERYLDAARAHVRPEHAIFTGYLTHAQLRYLFPCCDAAVFPSVVREAGPLVFLEALASGAFPLGTYFGGMAASIDTVAAVLPAEVAEIMKLRPAPEHTVSDIVRQVPRALAQGERWSPVLFELARDRYDWSSVAEKLNRELEGM